MSGVKRPLAEILYCCWPRCRAEVYDDPASPPFCGKHLIQCATFVSEKMGIFLLDPRPEVQAHLADERERAIARGKASVVYYVRLGRHVKIGTTVDLAARMRALGQSHPPEDVELLATEPGGHALEAQRHREFAPERADPTRELFNPSRRLLAHVDSLRPAQPMPLRAG